MEKKTINNNYLSRTLGFTLIELLAIIVILAIIAVITVPIILNVIDNAKRGTVKDSAYGYKDAINKYYVASMLESDNVKLDDTYNVVNGKLGEYDIPFSGTKPTSGYLSYENNKLTSGCLTIDEYKVTFSDGEVEDVSVGKCEEKKYKCKRAIELHVADCAYTSPTYNCAGAGYTSDVKGKTITFGNTSVTRGILTSGDAFDCDVDGDGTYDATKERFYYVSDLYDTKTKHFNNDYGVFIYFSNVANGSLNNTTTGLSAYHSLNTENWHGPDTAIKHLPTLDDWKNVSLSSSLRTIVNENGEATTNNGSNNLPLQFSYEGFATRLLTTQELDYACDIVYGSSVKGGLGDCIYLLENTNYINSSYNIYGYWLENAYSSNSFSAWDILIDYSNVNFNSVDFKRDLGVRPVIEVKKDDIEI